MTKILITSKQLKEIHKASGLTLRGFAKRLGYSESYIRHLESGSNKITQEFTDNLMKALELGSKYKKACELYSQMEEKRMKVSRFRKMQRIKYIALILIILILVILF